eukprot:3648198-Amphidinium_carterae.1
MGWVDQTHIYPIPLIPVKGLIPGTVPGADCLGGSSGLPELPGIPPAKGLAPTGGCIEVGACCC